MPVSRFNLVDLSRTIWSCCKNFSLSFLDIGNSYTFFFSVGVDSGSPYQLLYSWICLAVVGWGGVVGVGRRRKAGGIIQQTNNRSAPTCFLIRLPTKFRENCEPRKSILAAILSFEKGLVDRGESMSTLGDKWVY